MKMRPYYRSQARYWELMETVRRREGALPENAFDYISVHFREDGYGLLSPLLFVERLAKRPRWEGTRFPDFKSALRAARILRGLAKLSGVQCHIVSCTQTRRSRFNSS